MAQQTAVEWLFIELYEKFEMKGDGMEMDKVLEQAKQMFEEQVKDAWDNAAINASYSHNPKSFEQYYNETYGK